MATRNVATVFGGSGFIGRYVVKRLAHKGFVVRVAVRDPEAALFLKTAGAVGQVVPLFASVENEATVHRAVEGAGLVVNLVGILAEGHAGDFQRIHAEGAGRVARLAAAAGVERLVHLSAIGADPASPSRYGTSKAAGEQAVRAAFPARHHPAPLDRVRAGGQVLQPLRRDWRGCRRCMPVICRGDQAPAGLCRRRGGRDDGGAGAGRRRRRAVRTGRARGSGASANCSPTSCRRPGGTG